MEPARNQGNADLFPIVYSVLAVLHMSNFWHEMAWESVLKFSIYIQSFLASSVTQPSQVVHLKEEGMLNGILNKY